MEIQETKLQKPRQEIKEQLLVKFYNRQIREESRH